MRARITRFAVLFSVLTVIIGLILAGSAFAGGGVTKYPWNLPANVRIVQKDTVDNVRIFSTITAALNSITDASATNRYLIKVMPGVYDEAVVMKNYVDLEGGGQENTTIKSGAYSTGGQQCTSATVKMASNMTLRNVKVMNYSSAPGYTFAGAVLFNNVVAKAEDIKVEITSGGTYENYGICATDNANATLDNVDVEVHNTYSTDTYEAIGIMATTEGSVTVTNSKIFAEGGQWAAGIYNASGFIDVRNSVVEAVNGWISEGLSSGRINVIGSKVSAKDGTSETNGCYGCMDDNITNSEIHATSTKGGIVSSFANGGGGIKIASTLIEGPILTSVKTTNCYDQNFNPIPNQ